MAGNSQNFLAGLGAALTQGSIQSQGNQDRKLREKREADERQLKLMDMALRREGMDLDAEQFAETKLMNARGFAKDVLSEAGPNAVLDDQGVQAVEAGGLGSRLTQPTFRIGPETAGAEVAPTRATIPTADQQFQLDTRALTQRTAAQQEERRKRALLAVDNEGFYKMPELQRATVWQDAGYDGAPPTSIEDWKQRQQFSSQLDLNNALTLEGARHRGDLEEIAGRTAATGAAGNIKLSATERNVINDSALSVSELNTLRKLRETYGKEMTGQFNGRRNAGATKMPESMRGVVGGLDKGYADFTAMTSSLRNRMIRAITGAAVGVQEEQRIMGEIPTEYDEPDIWDAKAQATEKNLRELAARIQSGATMAMPENFTPGAPQTTPGMTPQVRPGGGNDPLGLFK